MPRAIQYAPVCLAIAACQAPSDDTAKNYLLTQTDGQGTISVELHDNPLDAKSIWLNVEELKLRSCTGGEWMSFVVLDAEPFDLLSLQGGSTLQLLEETPVPSDHYCEMRLKLGGDASIEFEGGETHPLDVPSGQSSGIKMKGEIIVAPNLNTSIELDLDAESSIHQTGSGKYKMRPVINIVGMGHSSGDQKLALAGSELVGYAKFTVTPETEGTFLLPGGAELFFVSGSVLAPQEFTATAWKGASSAKSLQYIFSPSYTFEKPGEIAIPSTVSGNHAIYWDYEEQETSWKQTDGQDLAVSEFSHFSCVGAGSKFEGYPLNEWYSDPIVSMELRGVFDDNIFSSTYFTGSNPGLPISRGDFIAMHVRGSWVDLADQIAPSATPFADVPYGHPASGYIDFASDKGIIDGCSPGLFCVNDPLNRAAAAKILVRTKWEKGTDSDKLYIEGLTTKYSQAHASREFSDVKSLDEWYYRYVYAARDLNLMRGYDDGTFGPGTEINRVEAVQATCNAAFGAGCTGCKVTNYAPSWAANYAKGNPYMAYGDGGNPFLDFGDTDVQGGNCTNFASQSILAGLLRSSDVSYVYENKDYYKDSQGAWHWYYNDYDTFIRVGELRGYALGADGRGMKFSPLITRITPENRFEGVHHSIEVGDIVFADWDGGGSFDHTMIVVRVVGAGLTDIRLAYQSKDNHNVGLNVFWGLGDEYKNTVLEVYRPTHYQH